MRIKKHEQITQANITKVIELLNPTDGSKPITKKEACGILNIAYNTTRLSNIITEFHETMEFRAKRKAQNKGKAATPQEITTAVAMYLEGATVSDIAKGLYRSPAFVKGIIDRIGVPQKLSMTDYEGRRNAMLPEQCVSEEFKPEEKVWAIVGVTIAGLFLTGFLSAKAAGCGIFRPTMRVVIGGSAAMAVTSVVGLIFGAVA